MERPVHFLRCPKVAAARKRFPRAASECEEGIIIKKPLQQQTGWTDLKCVSCKTCNKCLTHFQCDWLYCAHQLWTSFTLTLFQSDGLCIRGVSNSSRTELFANFLEKARVRQVRTFFLSSRTVRGVCLPIIPLHNKQYNRYIFLKKHFFFFDLVRSAYFRLFPQANFANFFPNYSRTSSRTVRFGSKMYKIEFGSVQRFSKMHTSTMYV
jgi:hypothetical protein